MKNVALFHANIMRLSLILWPANDGRTRAIMVDIAIDDDSIFRKQIRSEMMTTSHALMSTAAKSHILARRRRQMY